MKELLDKTITVIPKYIADITHLLSGPKRFVLERVESDDLHLADALVFLAISFVIGFFLEVPFAKRDPLIELSGDAAFFAFQVIALGAALCLAWRVVRGRADIKTFFVIHFYYAGVLRLIMACSFMAMIGVLRGSDAQLYEDYMEAVYRGQALEFGLQNYERFKISNAYMPVLVVSYFCFFIMLVWTIAVWGAYRVANYLSRLRSGVAFMLFMLFSIPITALVALIANAAV